MSEIDPAELARRMFEVLEKQGPEVPYVGRGDDLTRVTLDGDFDLVALAEAIIPIGQKRR